MEYRVQAFEFGTNNVLYYSIPIRGGLTRFYTV
jgi:hypothetical protein